MRTWLVLFTRDLRVRDNPALHDAAESADRVIPLFVVDPALAVPPNRQRFLAECLDDLRTSLRLLGGDLFIRYGDPVAEAVKLANECGAESIGVAEDVSAYSRRRKRRLAEACSTHRLELRLYDSVTAVPAGAVRPTGGGDHYRVFTPYWHAWQRYRHRTEVPSPRRIVVPADTDPGVPASSNALSSAVVAVGGESAAARRTDAWRRSGRQYSDHHNDLAADNTSRLSPYLHFGCISAITTLSIVDGPEEFVRQLCWRDFYHQLLAGFPDLGRQDYRPRVTENWRDDPDALAAWQAGQTGVPIVDAGMRQLAAEGFMHNRARLITASFLTKSLGLDWRVGMQWYAGLLLDADVANNAGNWQWVAGTGTDTRPHRQFNPLRQAERFDPEGEYVRRWVPEVAAIPGRAVHRPWLDPSGRRTYPPPLGAPGKRARNLESG